MTRRRPSLDLSSASWTLTKWMSANRLKLNMDKTELLWAGTRHSLSMGDGSFPSLQLGWAIIAPRQHVRVLGMIFSADLSLEKHVSNVSATCFHHLRRLRHILHSLTSESAMMLVHAFVMSRVDYCNVVFAGAPKIITNKLQWVLNSAARVVSGTRKFDRGLTQLMHTEFHWLDVPERVKYKLSVITRRCLYGSAPRYLAAYCVPVSTTASRQHLCSAAGHQLVIPSHQLTPYGRRAFSVAGPMFWNSLPQDLRDPSHTAAVFGRSLKTFLFS